MRVVTENSRTLKVASQGFEAEYAALRPDPADCVQARRGVRQAFLEPYEASVRSGDLVALRRHALLFPRSGRDQGGVRTIAPGRALPTQP